MNKNAKAEMPMKRGVITMTDGGVVIMPQRDVWMTVDEIADMFGVLNSTIFRTVRSIYRRGELDEQGTKQLIPIPNRQGWAMDVYNLELILYLTYKVPSRNARIFRQYMTNKAYARNPYEHICIIVDDVDFKSNIKTIDQRQTT